MVNLEQGEGLMVTYEDSRHLPTQEATMRSIEIKILIQCKPYRPNMPNIHACMIYKSKNLLASKAMPTFCQYSATCRALNLRISCQDPATWRWVKLQWVEHDYWLWPQRYLWAGCQGQDHSTMYCPTLEGKMFKDKLKLTNLPSKFNTPANSSPTPPTIWVKGSEIHESG